ncbi:hypothetical protein M427DRAFT_59641 [Gonapodya prolifera JEL478]|uniref:Uncharacterized protein n=1 Tax=Gonapodya prolifera (strain JEL478) TaxID=1344416 RepID=A0A139A6E4_GONPJ|nr:hypothetical protein M427DRAFT_59641 [Gonapodya prolifera JEL478]|eukprot:KXS12304.1 hypothetical protein M427DRAFT_59641 [Gonapodya prolifera JEL478]
MPTMLPPAAMSPPMVSPPNSPVTGARQRPGQTELPLTQQLGAVLGPGDLPTPSLPTPSQDIMGPLHPPPHTLPPPTLMPSPLPTPPLSAAPLTPNANGHASPPPQHPRVNLTLRDHSDDTPISPTVEAPDTLGGTWWRLGAGAGGSDVQLTNGQTSASILSPPRDTRPPTNQQSPPEGPNGTARSRSPSWWGLGALALVGAATTSASPANPANGSPPQAPTTPGTSSPPNTRGPTWPSLSALLTPSLLNPNPMTTSLSPPVTTFNPARSYRRPPSPSPVRLPTLSVSSLVASEAAKSKLGTAWRERSRSRGRTGALIGGAAFVVDRTLEREGRGDTGGAERDRNDDGAGGAGAASGTWWL